VQLDHDLQVRGQRAQSHEQDSLLFPRVHWRARRRDQRLELTRLEVLLGCGPSGDVAARSQHLVARNAEQERAKARRLSKCVQSLLRGEKRLLGEVLGAIGRSTAAKAEHAVKVPANELSAGNVVAISPALEQRGVRPVVAHRSTTLAHRRD